MQASERTALVAGHLTLDLVPDLAAFSAAEIGGPSNARIGAMSVGLGGSVGNAGAALSRLGVSTRLAGLVGDDHIGRLTRSRLGDIDPGLADGVETCAGAESSYSIVIAPADVDRVFWHHTGPNARFGPDLVSDTALGHADLLHFAYPTELEQFAGADGVETGRLLERAKRAGTSTCLDVTLTPVLSAGHDLTSYFDSVFPHLDIFQPDIEEATRLFFPEIDYPPPVSLDLLRRVSEAMLSAGVAIVALTLGKRGMYLRTTHDPQRLEEICRCAPADTAAWVGRELFAAPFRVDERSASAAGDAATAGFIAAIWRDLSPEAATAAAAGAGAWAVEFLDTTSHLPTWDALTARIESGWDVARPGVGLPGWTETGRPGIWAPGADPG